MRQQLPCPHCHESPQNLDMHLRFDCPKLYGRSRYTPVDAVSEVLPKFFTDIENFLEGA